MMMRLITAGVIALVIFVGIPLAQGEEGKAGQTSVTLTVHGIMCSSCQKNVEKTLFKLEGVADVKVDMKKNLVEVRYDGRKVTPRQMTEALEKAGFRSKLPNY